MFKVGGKSRVRVRGQGRLLKLILAPRRPVSKQIVSNRKAAVSADMLTDPQQANVFCGIDVSAETLAVAVLEQDQPLRQPQARTTCATSALRRCSRTASLQKR